MERFPHFTTDLQFIERLVAEESVHCMPGKCFNYPGYMRLVLTLPLRLLNEALDRIHSFCRSVMQICTICRQLSTRHNQTFKRCLTRLFVASL